MTLSLDRPANHKFACETAYRPARIRFMGGGYGRTYSFESSGWYMHPIAKTCLTCGSRKIRVVHSDYPTTVRGRRVVIPELERQECPNCGEILFDRSAMKRIQSFWPNKKRQTA